MDDYEKSVKGIFEEISHEFNNENVVIKLPAKADNIEGVDKEDLDTNN